MTLKVVKYYSGNQLHETNLRVYKEVSETLLADFFNKTCRTLMAYYLSHTMIISVFLLVAVSYNFNLVVAEDKHRWNRALQQRQIQYETPDGSKVNGKFYSPNTQWYSEQESNQRPARQEAQKKISVPVAPPQQPETEPSYQYKPFSAVPEHIKQLIYQVYTPQVPYVNPYAFFYDVNPSPVSQDILEHSTTPQPFVDPTPKQAALSYRTNYPSRSHTIAEVNKAPKQGGIKYKEDSRNSGYHFGDRNQLYSRQQDQSKRSLEKDIGSHEQVYQSYQQKTPNEIQQLLHFQSQIPYNVLANHIGFQFEKPFVPKPLPDELLKSSSYPTKVYYIKPSGEIVDAASVRDVPGRDIKYSNV
ncbi:uncharacterized protein [Chelonus insularis]|uniref:uncharacterized protein n=1 Tax=Chelonus insularis TaxID=460826 RepID=UPI00158E41BC|nr:uncharacterized protein LOC118067913 [Chelonus insularis]